MIAPYSLDAANHIYNLLFCDDLSLWNGGTDPQTDLWRVLALDADAATLRVISEKESAESRLRVLAFNRLRAMGEKVTPGILLGTIVEVPLDGGLDTLAVFTDQRIRYINQTGKMAVFEAPLPLMKDAIAALMAASKTVVSRIGPWDKPRLPPPPKGSVRLSFLVSDGLYFGQGPFEQFSRDAMAGPVIQHAGELLVLVTNAATGH
ncbi:MAG TPA: hypothetical protein VGU69_17970 [Rhizomicrobium sp.]|nr:hypothetical protein [Rhizomicrobium sp.]